MEVVVVVAAAVAVAVAVVATKSQELQRAIGEALIINGQVGGGLILGS